MLQGANILGFFENKENRRWNNCDVKDFIVVFDTKTSPGFSFAYEVIGEFTGVATLINAKTEQEIDANTLTITDDASGYKIVSFPQTTIIPDTDDGYYYLQVSLIPLELGGDIIYIYSEVFNIVSDVSGFVKFEIESSDITMNGSIVLPYSTLNISFYLPFNGVSIACEPKDEGVEKSFGDIPVFSTVNILNKLEINGTSQIFRMLSFLRPLCVNGEVHITIYGIRSLVYDLSVEAKDDLGFGDSIIIILTYREYNFISSRNAI